MLYCVSRLLLSPFFCFVGTTRRWMCHGFQASRDSGERLSHAVGCAFAVCLERKQQRDKESKDAALQVVSLQQGHQGQPGYPQTKISHGSNQAHTSNSSSHNTTTRENNNFRRAASMRCPSSAVKAPLDPQVSIDQVGYVHIEFSSITFTINILVCSLFTTLYLPHDPLLFGCS